ncbi:MAG TPA: hypothetical protein VLE73_02550 [Candidatus Saccharimonadales bacterium]|nr:hypothetical protein [Candidatus Saccharimonadales bacterium]
MIKTLRPFAPYYVVALLVLLPMLRPGYILTLDMVFTPWLPMPSAVTSSYLFHAGLHVLNFLIPSSIIQKLLLLSILLLASIGMHRLVRSIAREQNLSASIYIASIFFAINPFTYSRFMAGQYAVLLGYALLPWLTQSALVFAVRPNLRQACWLGVLITIIGIVSIHTLAAVAILGGVGGAIGWWRHTEKRGALVRYGLVILGTFVVLSSYWLLPLLAGKGKTAAAIGGFTSADTQAFMTTGTTVPARMFHSLRLQGFWLEDRGLYALPQDRTVLWGLSSLIFIALAIAGAHRLWRTRRALVLWLGVTSATAIVIAAGALSGLLTALPLGAGLREPHKLVMLVALAYGVFLAFGCQAFLEQLRSKHQMWHAPAMIVLLVLPLSYTRAMLWGFNGQLTPRQYPSDWFMLRQQLAQSTATTKGHVLFLPWHQYMTFAFADRIIANPAPDFFGKNVIVSNDPELDGAASYAASSAQKALGKLVVPKGRQNTAALARELNRQNVAYVVLTNDYDYDDYDYLTTVPTLQKQAVYPTLTLYKNTAWRHT